MKATIYYFTSTGNSLNVARRFADKLGNTELVSIPQAVLTEKVEVGSDVIGIVTPVYAMGAPRIVTEFLEKMMVNRNQYVFVIATCNGMASSIFRQMNKVLKKKGKKINAGFAVKEQYHEYPDHDSKQVQFNRSLSKKKVERMVSYQSREKEIIECVRRRQDRRYEDSSFALNLLGNMVHDKVVSDYMKEDVHFRVNEDCTDCGVCEQVCPRQNIQRINGQPRWQQNCEMCFGCYQWCPKAAIDFKGYRGKETRGHHDLITLKDML